MTPQQENPQGMGIVISFPQMYEAIQQVSKDVSEVAGDVREINTKLDSVISSTEDHENRIRTLERKVWGASGVAGSLGGLLGYVVSLFR